MRLLVVAPEKWGGKVHLQGGKNPKIYQIWLILCYFITLTEGLSLLQLGSKFPHVPSPLSCCHCEIQNTSASQGMCICNYSTSWIFTEFLMVNCVVLLAPDIDPTGKGMQLAMCHVHSCTWSPTSSISPFKLYGVNLLVVFNATTIKFMFFMSTILQTKKVYENFGL